MADKYKNKYRTTSTRLHGYDYGSNGAYFISICTQNRECFFGEIVNNEMLLNQLGDFAHQFCLEIPNHFPFVELGNFVVMPNHVHVILIVNKSINHCGDAINNCGDAINNCGDVETRLIASPQLLNRVVLRVTKTLCYMIIFPESLDGIKDGVHSKYVKYTQILRGNQDFMIISFVIQILFIEYQNI